MTDLFCIRAHAAFVKAAVDLAVEAGNSQPERGDRLEQVREWHAQAIERVAEAAGLNTVGLSHLLIGDWVTVADVAGDELDMMPDEADEHEAA